MTGQPHDTIERLCGELEHDADARALGRARALVHAVLDLHQAGLARLLELVGGEAALRLADDARVASLLLLHGLHPRPFGERARAAVAGLGPDARLLDAADGHVRVRCAVGARAAVEAALCEAVPDAAGVEIEELLPASAIIPIERLRAANAGPRAAGGGPR